MLQSSFRNAAGREHNYEEKMNKCPVLLVALRLCAVEMLTSAALLKPRLNSCCGSCNSNIQ